jgi:hypothetical protein
LHASTVSIVPIKHIEHQQRLRSKSLAAEKTQYQPLDNKDSKEEEEEDEEEDGLGPMPASLPLQTKKRSSSVHSETAYHTVTAPVEVHAKETHTTSALFVVAFLGSVDDLTLFVPMLVGNAIPWPALGNIYI